MTHILVTTDLSDESTKAFSQASEIAQAFGAETKVTMLSVIEDLAASSIHFQYALTIVGDSKYFENAKNTANDELEKLAKVHFPKVNIHTEAVISKGTVSETILSYAKNNKVSLIVLSSHGRSGVEKVVLGSTADSLIHHSNIPVLIVPIGKNNS